MPVVLAMLLLLGLTTPVDAVIYRWIDEHGTVNFDDDIERVPESRRPAMRVFASKTVNAPVDAYAQAADRPSQAVFARRLARDLGLQKSATQDPVSVLQIVGIYPAIGWYPTKPLTPAVVDEVIGAAVAAARARRLRQTAASAEATVLRVAEGLGIDVPPPSIAPDPPPPPPEPAPIIVAPNIIVEAAAPAPVIVEQPYSAGYYGPYLAPGVLFQPIRHASPTQQPPLPRIPPLKSPAGHLRAPVIPSFTIGQFTRPPNR